MKKEFSSVEEYVKRKVTPIFNKVLKETNKNRVSVGKGGFSNNFAYYQPHNCRVYFDYVKPVKPMFGGLVVVKNSSELMFKELQGDCRVTIKKHTVELINLIDKDKRFIVNMSNSFDETVNIIVSKINQCMVVFKGLIKLYGGSSSFKVVNFSVQDNKVEHESFIDSIKLKSKFRNKVVKKVYGKHNVEFSDPVYEANYLTNQAALMGDFCISRWCEQNINSFPDDVFKLESVIKNMSYDYRCYLSGFLFERFGNNGGV